jgi:hypothetical protein
VRLLRADLAFDREHQLKQSSDLFVVGNDAVDLDSPRGVFVSHVGLGGLADHDPCLRSAVLDRPRLVALSRQHFVRYAS